MLARRAQGVVHSALATSPRRAFSHPASSRWRPLLRDPSLGRELLLVVSGRSPMPAGLHALAGPGKSTGWELSLQIRDA